MLFNDKSNRLIFNMNSSFSFTYSEIVLSKEPSQFSRPEFDCSPRLQILKGAWLIWGVVEIMATRLTSIAVTFWRQDPTICRPCVKARSHLLWRIPIWKLANIVIIMIISESNLSHLETVPALDSHCFLCPQAQQRPFLCFWALYLFKCDFDSALMTRIFI